MVVWMRKHARGLKRELEGSAGAALARRLGAGARRDGVLRRHPRGLRDRGVPARRLRRVDAGRWPPGAARCSGSLVAVALGWGIYRGGVQDQPRALLPGHERRARARRGRPRRERARTRRTRPAGSRASRRRRSTSSGSSRPGSVRSALLTGMLGLAAAPGRGRGRRLPALRDPDAARRALAARPASPAPPAEDASAGSSSRPT